MKELVVPLLIVGVLASIILPLPTIMLDFLIVANLILALVLVISTLYLSDALKLSSLPALLLLATLYRLALNISTTRSVLSRGEAGEVVDAFGSLVIQGNLFVGVVVFLIITLVQFIVIAKGSERVAEVSARFTLDALPGKQMSIDADVRAGLIDFATARAKRQDLQTESRFYGALDGAMKFVKGDAIAGMIILVVNIVGGLIVGVAVEQLDVATAVTRYTRLTIGDGLVAQIPALLNSLAAGIVVTRVARGDDKSLSLELLGQIGQVRVVKGIIGFLSIILAFTPGMPVLPFLTIGLLLVGSMCFDLRRAETQESVPPLPFSPRPPAPLRIEFGRELVHRLRSEREVQLLIERVREDAFNSTGLALLPIEVAVHPELGHSFNIRVRGLTIKPIEVSAGEERPADFIHHHLIATIEERAVELIDDSLTRRLLDSVEAIAPDLAAGTVPGVITLTQLTELLKNLMREQIPVKNFDQILQAVSEYAAKSANDRVLLEAVREQLRWVIAARVSRDDGSIQSITLDGVTDLALCQAEREQRVMELSVIDAIIEGVKRYQHRSAVLVVSRGARRLLSDYLRLKGVGTLVIAHEEIPAGFTMTVIGHISIEGADREMLVERLAA